jgi:hypothetical protein
LFIGENNRRTSYIIRQASRDQKLVKTEKLSGEKHIFVLIFAVLLIDSLLTGLHPFIPEFIPMQSTLLKPIFPYTKNVYSSFVTISYRLEMVWSLTEQ